MKIFRLASLLALLTLLTVTPVAAQMSFANGNLAWNSADAATTVYTVSGLSFQPECFQFTINGMSSATDAASQALSGYVGMGFAGGTGDQRAVSILDVDTPTAADTQSVYRTDAVVVTVSSAGAVDGRLRLDSVTSDGFTLEVDDAAPVDLRVFWNVWGGDITNCVTGEIAEPAAGGAVDYVVTGSFQPEAVLFAGTQLTGAAPTAAVTDGGMMFGAATGTGAGNQWAFVSNSDEASGTMDADSASRGDRSIINITVAGGLPNARASLTAFNVDGFELNWAEVGVTNRRYIYMAIRGGTWQAGNFTSTLNLNDTATVSGLSFQPRGSIFVTSDTNVEFADDNSGAHGALDFGSFASTSSRQAWSYVTENGTAVAEIDLVVEYDAILGDPTFGGLIEWVIDINTINSDGFQTIVDDGLGAVSVFIGYLAVGDEPAAPTGPAKGTLLLMGVGR